MTNLVLLITYIQIFMVYSLILISVGKIHVGGVTEEEKEHYEQQAKQQDCSMAQWGRRAFRQYSNMWDAEGEFDHKKFDRFFDTDQSNESSKEYPQSMGNNDLAEAILRELSTTEPTDFDEIINLAIAPLVANVLNDLQDRGKINFRSQEGYLKDG